jgi:F0F1-type ATP synthase delta subunit
MKQSAKKMARVLFDEVQSGGADKIDDIVGSFIEYLAGNHRLSDWRKIVGALDEIWREEFGAASVDVVAAHDLSKELIKKIIDKAGGASVNIKTDPEKIGGLSVRVDDRIVDCTLATKLQSLKQHLAN